MTTPIATTRRRWVRPVLAIVGSLVAIAGVFLALNWSDVSSTAAWLVVYMRQPAATPAPAESRDERWQQDIEYLASQLPALHANAFFRTPRETFEANAAKLKADVPTLNDQQIGVGVMRLVASVGDSHTSSNVIDTLKFREYPIRVGWLTDGLYVLNATDAHREAIGTRLVKIGDQEALTVMDAIKPLFAWDNESQLKNVGVQLITVADVLYGLGVLPDMERGRFTVQPTEGDAFTLDLTPLPADQEVTWVSIYDKAGVQPPITLPNRRDFYWFEVLPETKTLYFHYRVCGQQEGRPFDQFANDMFAAIDQQGLERVVIDLRYNGGGNSAVLRPFIDEMKRRPALNANGKFAVLIGRRTFSSAMQNAIELKEETEAVLLGEPTGGKPNSYGELKSFYLPNSQIRIWYSTRYWLNMPNADPPALMPDVEVQRGIQDYLTGRDSVLDAALKL